MTTVEPGILCARCDGVIYPLDGVRLDEGWVHANPIHCYHFAQDRALLAAHQLGEVREGLADARATAAAERGRVLALEKRVAELQEQWRWRPFTELPPADGVYPYITRNGYVDQANYTRAGGWNLARQHNAAGWFLLPPSDDSAVEAARAEIDIAAAAESLGVAELEEAEREWRPVGGNPPPAGRMFEIRRANCSLFPTYAYGKPAKKAVGSMDGEFICWWVFGNGWEWRPHYELQPAPDQEPQ